MRYAATDKGWSYLAHSIELTTSTLGASFSEDWKGSSLGDTSLRFYDSNDQEIVGCIDNCDNNITYSSTQEHIDTKCVKTTLTLDLGVDYDIVSGMLSQARVPKDITGNLVDVRFHVLVGVFDDNGVPFDPDGPGTGWSEQVTEFVSGFNLKFLGSGSPVKIKDIVIVLVLMVSYLIKAACSTLVLPLYCA